MKGVVWKFLTPNLVFAGAILATILFWQAVEAPQNLVESGHDMVLLESQAEPEPSSTSTPVPTETPVAIVVAPVVVVATPTKVPEVLSSSPDIRVPILMYHRIDWLPPDADALRKSLSISPTEFDRHVSFLKERGFTSISLDDVYNALQGKRALPPKPVVLTFDDGYTDNYVNAFPILKRHGFSGTFFILTDVAGTSEYMNWDQLREMAAVGMKIEVHGRSHLDLTKLTAAGVTGQAKGAKDAIQSQIGRTSLFYSYPSGRYNRDVIDVIKAHGFLAAVTTNYGSDHNLQRAHELKRVRIDGRESFAAFAKKVGENP